MLFRSEMEIAFAVNFRCKEMTLQTDHGVVTTHVLRKRMVDPAAEEDVNSCRVAWLIFAHASAHTHR